MRLDLWYKGEALVLAAHTGKSLSEALIFASTNPQYDYRLFIELQVQYMKIASCNYMLCTEIVLNVKTKTKKQFLYTACSEHVLSGF